MLNAIGAAHHHRTRSFLGYQQTGNPRRAAWLAAWLAREQVFFRSNVSAMNGWFARAERLLAGLGSCLEQGWLNLYRVTMTAPPAELRAIARATIVLARAHGDADLAALAIANTGMGTVATDDLVAGLTHVDGAMTMATGGEVQDHFVVCEIFCVTLDEGRPVDDIPGFGAWLKCRRKAPDLTQDALARRVGCSVVSIRKYEGDEQRPSRQLSELLAEHLAIPPADRATFVQYARRSLDTAPPE